MASGKEVLALQEEQEMVPKNKAKKPRPFDYTKLGMVLVWVELYECILVCV